MHVWMYVFIYVCMFVCMFGWMDRGRYIRTYLHMYLRMQVRTYVCIRIRMWMYMCIYIYIYIYKYIYIYIYTHIKKEVYNPLQQNLVKMLSWNHRGFQMLMPFATQKQKGFPHGMTCHTEFHRPRTKWKDTQNAVAVAEGHPHHILGFI